MLSDLIEDSLVKTGENSDEGLDDSVDMEVIDALTARERLGCTGLGHGVAIPHGRVDFITEPIGAAITLAEPIEFDAADREPVDLVVGLLIPESDVDGHLQILANLAKFLNETDNREAMRSARSKQEIQTLLQNLFESDESPSEDDSPGADN